MYQKRPWRFVCSVLAVLGGAGLVVGAQERPTFRAGTELVSLSVTATDARGKYVAGLTAGDFVVLEDGLPQDVVFFSPAEGRLAVSLLIDSSGSMEHRLGLTRKAARTFVAQLRPGDIAQIVEFNDRVQIVQPFTGDQAALAGSLDQITIGGLTSLYNAVYIALRSFEPPPVSDADAWRRHVIVVLSDGEDTASLVSYDTLLDAAKRSQTVIYTIGLALEPPAGDAPERIQLFLESPRFVLRRLADETGGRILLADRADQLGSVYEEIANELAHQYVLGYQPRPSNARNEWRTLGVQVNQPNVQARTRPGYFAGEGLRVAAH